MIDESHSMTVNDKGITECEKCWWCACHNSHRLKEPCDQKVILVQEMMLESNE